MPLLLLLLHYITLLLLLLLLCHYYTPLRPLWQLMCKEYLITDVSTRISGEQSDITFHHFIISNLIDDIGRNGAPSNIVVFPVCVASCPVRSVIVFVQTSCSCESSGDLLQWMRCCSGNIPRGVLANHLFHHSSLFVRALLEAPPPDGAGILHNS